MRNRVFLFFAALAVGAVLALAVGLNLGYRRLEDPAVLPALIQGGFVAAFRITGLVVWVWFLFDSIVAKPIDILSGALRARAHADVTSEMDVAMARYLCDPAPAASAAAHRLAETRSALELSVQRETQRLSEEKARLETLLSDVPVGVLLCSADHSLAFYNPQAVDLMAAGSAPGLDRGLFDYLREGPVRHAYDRLLATEDPDAATDILCTTIAGAKVLSARMRLTSGAQGSAAGYVLTLRDVTADLSAHAHREALMAEVFDRLRRPAANLSTLMEVIPAGEAGPGPMDTALRQEVSALTHAVIELSHRYDEAAQDGWQLVQTRASDLADGLKARLEGEGVALATTAANLLLRCNGFEIVSLLDGIALHLRDGSGAQDLTLTIEEEDSGAMIRLCWQGRPAGKGEMERWLLEPLDKAVPEIASRSVPLSSTEVHGITEAMVADAPEVEDALCRFHKFAEGAVLIAHNAPFDMQFLRRREAALGLAFVSPVLDTVLLSAVVYGQHELHSLDALTHRLGITIPDADRHTAIDDTVATADASLKLMPMLKGRNLATLGDVLTEVRKHGRLLKDINA